VHVKWLELREITQSDAAKEIGEELIKDCGGTAVERILVVVS